MSDDNNTNTGGGSFIQGNVGTGRDFVGRDVNMNATNTTNTTIVNRVNGNVIITVVTVFVVGFIAVMAVIRPYNNDSVILIWFVLIVIGGILVGSAVVYKQWNQHTKIPYRGEFEKTRQTVYKEIWQRVENLSIRLRLEEVSKQEFSHSVTELNVFMLQNGIYLDSDTKLLVNRYTEAVKEFQQVVKSSENEEAKVSFGATEMIPESVLAAAREIRVAQEKVLNLRTELIGKIQLVLSGKKYL